MAIVAVDQAELQFLENIFNRTTPEDLTVHLYANDVTPAQTDTEAQYTEVTGGGYAEVDLVPALWVITGIEPTKGTYPQITWTFTAAVGTVYGYYVTGKTSGNLLWSERFSSAPINVQNADVKINVTLIFTLN